MQKHALDTATLDQLLKAIRERFSYTSNTRDQTNLILYEEFLKRCHKNMLNYVKTFHPLDKNVIFHLREVAKLCEKVDRKVTKSPLLAIEEVSETVLKLSTSVSIQLPANLVIHKMHLNNDKAAYALVNKQARRYMQEAFSKYLFDEATSRLNDAADIIELAHCIYVADLVKAKEKSHVDTVVREDFPAVAWKWMQKNL